MLFCKFTKTNYANYVPKKTIQDNLSLNNRFYLRKFGRFKVFLYLCDLKKQQMAIINNPKESTCRCFAVINHEQVLRADGSALDFHDLMVLKDWCVSRNYVFDFFEEKQWNVCALGLSSKEGLPSAYTFDTIRHGFSIDSPEETLCLSRAKAIVAWRSMTHYCAACGGVLKDHLGQTARYCIECGQMYFPRIEPCIITIVSRKDGKILLAKHVNRSREMYACIAGFIEAGETAEQAVAREVMEETGYKVKNIRYYGSQSWPFPSQFMLGFTCEYDGGDMHLQEDELADAKWFERGECPITPPPGSIAYRLINNV